MSIKIDFSAFEQDIKKYMAKYELPKIVRSATELSINKLRRAFIEEYRKTDFSIGLRGGYAGDVDRDVMAILGFYPFDVDDIDEKIGNILGDSLKFTKFISRNNAIYFQLTSENLSDFLRDNYPGGSYDTDSGARVDWLNWILFDGRVDANLIIGAFDESRSGRGIMLHLGRGDWQASDYDVFPASSSGGFIAELLNSESFKEKAIRIITENIQKVVG